MKFWAENLKLYKSALEGPSGSGLLEGVGLRTMNIPIYTKVSPAPEFPEILSSIISTSSCGPTTTLNKNESATVGIGTPGALYGVLTTHASYVPTSWFAGTATVISAMPP